jgi:uncharacterized protein YwgA
VELLERTAIIGEIARRKRGGQLGKTAVVKLLHLLQDGLGAPLGYRFTLYNYGPYDTEVMSDIEFAESLGQISVAYQGPDQGYRIEARPGTHSASIGNVSTKLDALMEHFGSMNARELELRSTLVFLAKKYGGDLLISRLRELKPKYSESEVRSAVRELHEKRLLPAT